MYDLSIITNIGVLGETEDGRPYTGEIFCILAETEDGSRYLHVEEFPAAWTEWSDEGQHIVHIEVFTAATKAEELRNRLLDGNINVHDTDVWIEVAPRYGSTAYLSLNLKAIEEI